MVGGGRRSSVGRTVVGEFADFSVSDVPAEGWWAFVYLTLIGSVVAFSAFVWLLGSCAAVSGDHVRLRQPGGGGLSRLG